MALWRIRPVAGLSDSRWQAHAIYDNVIVRADTPIFARIVAAVIDYEDEKGEPPTGNESGTFSSAFLDEKLYQVQPLNDSEAESYGVWDGPPEVLDAQTLLARQRL